MIRKDAASLFNNRVENYVKYRPSYPIGLLNVLKMRANLSPGSVVADIGSGTGKLTELFLKSGNRVFAVEPNSEMRRAAEKLLCHYPNFTSVTGSAEATTLAYSSIDLITAGQSFHWFERPATRMEFKRILKPGGWVVLAWNTPRTDTPFLEEYAHFRQTALKGAGGSRKEDPADVFSFYSPGNAERVVLTGIAQDLDFDQLLGRVLSISMAVQAGEPGHEAFSEELRAMFERHQRNNLVRLSYDTEVFIGQLD